MYPTKKFRFSKQQLFYGIDSVIFQNFTISSSTKEYKINSFAAAAKSKTIRTLLTENCSLTKYTMNTTTNITPIINYFNGQNFDAKQIPQKELPKFLDAIIELGCQQIIDDYFPSIFENLNKKDFILLSLKCLNSGLDVTAFAKYICDIAAANKKIEYFKQLVAIPPSPISDLLIDIYMSNGSFDTCEGDEYQQLLRQRIEKSIKQTQRLMKYYPFNENMSKDSQKIILSSNINIIRGKLISNPDNQEEDSLSNSNNINLPLLSYHYIEGSDPLCGLMRKYLKPNLKSTSVSDDPESNQIEMLLVNGGYFSTGRELSPQTTNQSITFIFNSYSIHLSSISISILNQGDIMVYPKSILIEGFFNSWIPITTITTDLSQSPQWINVKVNPSQNFSTIRLTQLESSSLDPSDKRFVLSSVEFFGDVYKY